MGLRCLLGHEYANREVEREREERGDEVVVTYRTVETCERCGERRIVSENKEVRPVRGPTDDGVATGLGGEGGVTPDLGEESADAEAPVEPEGTVDAEGAVEAESAEAVDADADPEPESPETDAEDESVDDAVILDDDATDDRRTGEWPDATDDRDDEESVPDVDDGTTVVSGGEDWPDPGGEDEGFDAEPSDGEPANVDFGGGLAPDSAAGDGEVAATNGSAAGKQFVAAETVEPVGDDGHEGATEFFCPNCGFARAAGGSSMRAGDICPDCHQGYIAEREP
ncbi:MAG: hypothetical protein ABEI80_07280 [Haloplanus sp.]